MKLICSILDNVDMWPMFYKFYKDNGVTEFIINSYGPTVEGDGVTIYRSVLDPTVSIGSQDAAFYNRYIQENVGEDEWCIFVDLDEFVCMGKPNAASRLVDHIKRADFDKCEYIKGRFIDRVTEDGSFPKTLEDDLFAQFPVCRDISHGFMGGCGEKVVAAKGKCEIAQGHHYIVPKTLRMYDSIAGVHHFKFWGASEERIKARQKSYEENKIPWASQSSKFLQYMKDNNKE
jgi:hypothetical protein